VEANTQGIDKGWAYRALQRRLAASDLIVMAGDDRTDEDMFRAGGEDVWSIKVGPGVTAARYRVASPDRLRSLLSRAATARGGASEKRRPAPRVIRDPAAGKTKTASLGAGPAESIRRKPEDL